ncbi:gamma-hordein-3-like [Aegilops tauschii subsp. strangulata]|uniref:gamma-hordein-3-like n=1 Tax=Aegilops tauschii subsp. strangulata TaxID=200361 RepID=UPI003CC8B281
MKIFLLFALLVATTIITTTTAQLVPNAHDLERPQQSFPQQQPLPRLQPFPPQEPQQLPPQKEPQQSFPLQHPQPQQQEPLPQQHLFPQQPPQFLQQQPFYQHQQPYPQEQPLAQKQPFVEEKQQWNLCKEFLLRQCNPEEKVSLLYSVTPFLRPKTSQQNSCQLKRQECCRQLAHVSEQSRCPAIQSIVHAIVVQPQQLGLGMPMQPQQQLGQGFILPQQLAQFKLVRSLVIQTLPMLCNVYVLSGCYTIW